MEKENLKENENNNYKIVPFNLINQSLDLVYGVQVEK